uniref:Homoserine dehydrogenase n=1 Tax=Rhizochromulina marina TaxID=1034831 RepID=A0A7S2WAR1_9STRA|mmetsp:Transcript_19237/g.55962  ORF Transcript_19237/g.55962 Transcript_19237/m.55962 type:complete len:421 (+) Transcript_19237:3-1265(+)
MVGAGEVGGGVYEILAQRQAEFTRMGADVVISKICVRDSSKQRDFSLDLSKTQVVTDVNDILSDPSIDCVLELMGGVGKAKEVVLGAIAAGKHVVTANKALVASCLTEISDALAQKPQVRFAYEAAVCGGIPIINTLQQGLVSDEISEVMGIMNGTTNFMLSKMEGEGAAYSDVLAEAQALGYAEADPTADVEGFDVQAKIALITKLAFGVTVDPASIPTAGISKIDAVDFEYAKLMNATVKLLGTARLSPSKESLSVYVSPVVVPQLHPVASARGATNVVSVASSNLGSSSYVGPGAGRFPTANSVVSDVLRVAMDTTTPPFPLQRTLPLEPDYSACFYVRITVKDQLGIIANIGAIAAKAGVSIFSVLQNPITDPAKVDFVVTTDQCKRSQVQAVADEVSAQLFTVSPPLVMPMVPAP